MLHCVSVPSIAIDQKPNSPGPVVDNVEPTDAGIVLQRVESDISPSVVSLADKWIERSSESRMVVGSPGELRNGYSDLPPASVHGGVLVYSRVIQIESIGSCSSDRGGDPSSVRSGCSG